MSISATSKLSQAALALLLLVAACADDGQGTGTVSARVYGESFIEDGIPAAFMDDGWAVSFSRFAVSIHDVTVGGVVLADPPVVDLSVGSDGEGHELGRLSVAVGAHTEPSFSIGQINIEGSAEKDGTSKAFGWVFPSRTHYAHCETMTSARSSGLATFEITVHADHLFYDSLVAEEPRLLFQPLADADADEDGDVTEEELGRVDIGAYDPGNDDVDDLWGWLIAQTRTLGHVDGEGHCESSIAD